AWQALTNLWSRLATAEAQVRQEARALREAVLIRNNLPDGARKRFLLACDELILDCSTESLRENVRSTTTQVASRCNEIINGWREQRDPLRLCAALLRRVNLLRAHPWVVLGSHEEAVSLIEVVNRSLDFDSRLRKHPLAPFLKREAAHRDFQL